MTENPKLFISYSWTTPTHEKWVLTLAEELVSQGIDVIIDKWNLRPGQDTNAFMESMVTDNTVTKVLLICDAKYAERSDARTGGAGTEAQIVTPQLYAKRDQDKFVAVVREWYDISTPCLPVYYKGRLYFDLSDDAKYAQEFESLVRWAWDKPAFVKPELGKKPAFLADDASAIKMATTAFYRRAHDAIRAGRDHAEAALKEYLGVIVSELEKFRITAEPIDGVTFDERVAENVAGFTPYRNELIDILIAVAMYRPTEDSTVALHRFFEQLEPYTRRPENIKSWREEDYDNYRIIVHELFLYSIAILIKYERFNIAEYLINTEYYISDEHSNSMQAYTVFLNYPKSFRARDQRLQLLSSHADLLKQRCVAIGVEFRHLMAADFVLYLRACGRGWSFSWWPVTLIYASRSSNTTEIFARSRSRAYFDKIAPMLGVGSKAELEGRLRELDPKSFPRWQYQSVNPLAMARLDEVATTP